MRPSELSAHQMARPGHLRTQAYRSIFSQACDHGFQFSSMSGLPIIQTHKSPPGSLLSDSLSLLAHIQSSSWPSSGSCIARMFVPAVFQRNTVDVHIPSRRQVLVIRKYRKKWMSHRSSTLRISKTTSIVENTQISCHPLAKPNVPLHISS